jgi:glucokinase
MSEEQHLPLVIGVDLGGTQIRVGVLQGATLRSRVKLPTGEAPTPDRIIPCIDSAIEQALDEAGTRLDHIAGIGLGVAGPLDSRTGVVFAPPNLPGWDHVRLRDIFEEHYKMPIFVENDANAAGLGEYLFGAGRGCKDLVYLTISTGIGGGVIVNGQIMRGTSGTAGELGHMTIDWHGERCNCGNFGCLESIASGTAIARRANEAIARGVDLLGPVHDERERGTATRVQVAPRALHRTSATLVDAEFVARAALAGAPGARKIIEDAAVALGIGLVNIIHIFNPEKIIIGGGLTRMESLLLEPARQIVQERTMKVPYEATSIVLAELDMHAGLIGAGALVYYHRRESASPQLEEVFAGVS